MLATGSKDGTVRMWDPTTGAAIDELALGDQVAGIAADQDRLFIATRDGGAGVGRPPTTN